MHSYLEAWRVQYKFTLHDLSKLCLSALFCSNFVSNDDTCFCTAVISLFWAFILFLISFTWPSKSSTCDFAVSLCCLYFSWFCISSSITYRQKIFYIENLTWVLMFYWIYLTSWGKEIKCEACRAFYLFFATSLINRESYISAHVLLILLNKSGKRDKMRGLPSILSLFRNEFNKFNNTIAWMLNSFYHMTLRSLWSLISGVKTS